MDRTVPAVIVVVVLLGVLLLMARSWRKRSARDSTLAAGYAFPPAGEADAASVVTATTDNPQILAQLDYVNAHWSDYNDDYGVITGNDCVNFTSQSLVQRGWEMDDEWWSDGPSDAFTYSKPWVSSTAFRDYIDESGRATALTDDQRDQVKLGDIAQFDWDNSGDRDHTGVVTRIENTDGNIVIYYGGHTDDTDFRSVDWAIDVNHPGGTAYYWSIPE